MGAPAETETREIGMAVRLGANQTRSVDFGSFTLDDLFNAGKTGSRINQRRLRTCPETMHPTTFACMRTRAELVSRVPLVVRSGDRKNPELVERGPLVDLIESPNPEMSAAEFWQLAQMMRDADGAFLILLDPFLSNGAPKNFGLTQVPREMWLARLRDYEPIRTRRSGPITSWKNRENPKLEYPAHQVILDRNPKRGMHPEGQSLFEVARMAIEADYLAAVYQRFFVENDCNPSAWILLEDKVTPDQLAQLKALYKDAHEGGTNAGKTAFMSRVKQIIQGSTNLKEMQFLEGREAQVEEICMVFGVPKSLIGKTEDVNLAASREQRAAFYEGTGAALLRSHQDSLWNGLFRRIEGGRFWPEFDLGQVPELQKDQSERIGDFGKLVAAGVPRSVAAAKLGLDIDRFDGDDVATVGAGTVPLAFAVATPDPVDDVPEPEPIEPEADLEEQKAQAEQAAKILEILKQVTAKAIEPESAKVLLAEFYNLEQDVIDAMIDPIAQKLEENAAAAPEPPPGPNEESTDEGEESDEEEDDGEEEARAEATPRPVTRSRSHLARAIRRRKRRAAQRESWAQLRNDVISPAEGRFAKKMSSLLRRRRNEVLAILDKIADERRSMSRDESDFENVDAFYRPDDVSRFDELTPDQWEERSRESLTGTYDNLGRSVAEATLSDIDPDALVSDRVTDAWRRFTDGRLGTEIRNMDAESISQVRETFLKGLENGLTPNDIRKSLEDLPAFDRVRARRVAVTEMGGMANNTRMEQFEDVGIDRIEWVTTGSERVREQHLANEAHGPVERGEAFPSGARWPGDPQAEASDVIACECGAMAAVED